MSHRPRRAVRPSGTVGGDEADLRSVLPAAVTESAIGPASAAAARPASDDPAVAGRSADDSDLGWGDPHEPDGDDRLVREKPPHWA